jgi:hypothetical protein
MTAKRTVKETGPGGVQAYFDAQVEAAGGMTDVFDRGFGANGRPDRVVTWPMGGWARIHLVELKTIGGRRRPSQIRDHERRRKLGCIVYVLWTKQQVDRYIQINRLLCNP